MKEKLAEALGRLQGITIQASISNLEAMLKTLYDLRDVYNKLEEMGVEENAPDAE